MNQYLLIAEFSIKRLGFIIGSYDTELEAKSFIPMIMEQLTQYSLNSLEKIPAVYFQKYQSYKITGDEYFGGGKKYILRETRSNGDLTVFIVKCAENYKLKDFFDFRNLIKCYGIYMS